MNFKDYFSENAADYHSFRPQYPRPLFAYLSSLITCHDRAWDCATGNGQAAFMLADYFSEVIATDASSKQIEHAVNKPDLVYRVAAAEKSGIETGSVDMITVAQALHWFDLELFSKEVERVLKPGGVLAVWTYNLLEINPNINVVLKHFYTSTLGPYWPVERKMVENGYQDIRLPFKEYETRRFDMTAEWNLAQLIGYLSTWSAVKNFQIEKGFHPLEAEYTRLANVWQVADRKLKITWPLKLRICSKHG